MARSVLDEQFLRATEGSRDVIGLFDVEGRMLYANPPGRVIFEDPVGQRREPFEHLYPEDRERIRAEFAEIVRTGEPRRLQFRSIRGDGQIRLIQAEANPVRDAEGRVIAVLRIARDVTDERRDDWEREHLLDLLFEHAPIGIAIADADARIVQANRRFREMLGYTEAEVKGMTAWDVIHPDDLEEGRRLRGELWRGQRDGLVWERRFISKERDVLWVQNTVSLIRDPQGAPRYTMSLIEDVGERRLAQAAIQSTAEKLQALSRRLVELQEVERKHIARELHDQVGQTLTALRIDADMIRTRLAEHVDAFIRERNDDSMELIESLFRTVEDLMYGLRPPMIDEFGPVAAMRWQAKRLADRTSMRVEVHGEEIRCRPEAELALFRIAQEALNNVARHAQARNVDIDVHKECDLVVMTIEDDGVGFDQARDRAADAGYGLTTMRERTDALGGTFELQSEPGHGTRICVRVPQLK